jgi:putative transposase
MNTYKRLLKSLGGEPRKIVTDKLQSYGFAHRELIPDSMHDTSLYANNRVGRLREGGWSRFHQPHGS